MEQITASFDELMRQATSTAQLYLNRAIEDIDSAYDERGYTKKHPDLVAAYIKTCAADLNTSLMYGALGNLADSVLELERAAFDR